MYVYIGMLPRSSFSGGEICELSVEQFLFCLGKGGGEHAAFQKTLDIEILEEADVADSFF